MLISSFTNGSYKNVFLRDKDTLILKKTLISDLVVLFLEDNLYFADHLEPMKILL